jgi:hypothetical protein
VVRGGSSDDDGASVVLVVVDDGAVDDVGDGAALVVAASPHAVAPKATLTEAQTQTMIRRVPRPASVTRARLHIRGGVSSAAGGRKADDR